MISLAYEVELDYLWDGDAYRPVLPLSISARGEHRDTQALLDSGADYSVFDAELALELGLTLRDGEQMSLSGLSVSKQGYVHDVEIQPMVPSIALPTVRAQIVFLHGMKRNVLGRHDFFRSFVVGLDENKRKIYLGRTQ